MGFGEAKAAHDVLILAQPGDTFEIEVKKNDRGYNDWVSAVKGGAPTASNVNTSPRTTPTASPSGATAAPRSNYETPEERAKKQVYIVRQSSISNAVDLLSVGQKSTPDVDKVLEVAKRFEDYVFGAQVSDADVAGSFFPDSPKKAEPSLDNGGDDLPW